MPGIDDEEHGHQINGSAFSQANLDEVLENPDNLDLDSGLFEDAELEEELSRLRNRLEAAPSDSIRDESGGDVQEAAPDYRSNIAGTTASDKQMEADPTSVEAKKCSQDSVMSQPDPLVEDQLYDSLSPPTSIGFSRSSDDDELPVINPPAHRDSTSFESTRAHDDSLNASRSGVASQLRTLSPDRVLSVIPSPFESETHPAEKRILHSTRSKELQNGQTSQSIDQYQVETKDSSSTHDEPSPKVGEESYREATAVQMEEAEDACEKAETGGPAIDQRETPVPSNLQKWKQDLLDAERATQLLAEGHETGRSHINGILYAFKLYLVFCT